MSELRNWQEISITKSGLTSLITTRLMSHLTLLNMSHNHIERLEQFGVNSPPPLSGSLETIDLSHNRIEIISREFFANLYHLKHLDLSHNRLLKLSLEFNLQHGPLIQIYFSHNPSLSQMEHMTFNGKKRVSLKVWLLNTSMVDMPKFDVVDPASADFIMSYNSNGSQVYKTLKLDDYGESNGTVFVDWRNSTYLNEKTFESQKYAYIFNATTTLVLDNHTFKRLPNVSAINLHSFSMKNNRLAKLDNSEYLPKSLVTIDFSANQIEYITVGFFADFNKLESIILDNNRLKTLVLKLNPRSLNQLSFVNNRLEGVTLDFNTNKSSTELIGLIDLSSNNLARFPVISGKTIIGKKLNNLKAILNLASD